MVARVEILGFCGPEAKAIVMLGAQHGIAAARCLGHGGPLVRIVGGGCEFLSQCVIAFRSPSFRRVAVRVLCAEGFHGPGRLDRGRGIDAKMDEKAKGIV